MFVLATPDELIAGRESDRLRNRPLSLGDESAEITPANVRLDDDAPLHVLATDLCRTRIDEYVGHP